MTRVQATLERQGPAAAALVTRLYAVTPEEPDTRVLTEKVRLALSGGARTVQYRAKSADRALRRTQAEALCALCRDAHALFIVNDDLDLALSVGADGLHLGREDLEIERAREELGGAKLLGASCYDRLDLAVAAGRQGADYVAFGSVFPSPTKPGAIRAPLALFREARTRLDIPIVAIGGITAENARAVIDSGADAIAVISALFDAPDVDAAARAFDRLFARKSS